MEWDNWKTIYGNVKEDPHRAEWVNIDTGEVVLEKNIHGHTENSLKQESMENYYKGKMIHRNDVGDAFCTTDWSKH